MKAPLTRLNFTLLLLLGIIVWLLTLFSAPGRSVLAQQVPTPTPQSSPTGESDRGLVYDGLEIAPDSRCRGAYRLIGTQFCTHGPDPAPAEVNVKQSVLPLTISTATNSLVCDSDGTSGPRTQVMYVRASDRPDRYVDYVSSIQQWAADVDSLYQSSASETGGSRHIRFVHDASCNPIVLNVVLSPEGDDDLSHTHQELESLGFNREDRKYLAFVDATIYCGIALMYVDDQPGFNNSNNFGGLLARVDAGCWGSYLAAHEHMHMMGAVQLSSPNTSGGLHCVDEYDVMCYADSSNIQMRYDCPDPSHDWLYDCNHNDYFHTNPEPGSYLATHWNSANNQFLIGGYSPLKTTSTVLESSLNPSSLGQSVTFMATVSSAGGTPTGTVTFEDGTATLGNGNLDTSGKATFTTASLTVGSHSITAVYAGDNEFGASTSTQLTQVVNEPTIVTVENQDSAIQYDGWRGVSDANASGGTSRVSNVANDLVKFTFTGKSVKWISFKGLDQGMAWVLIDGLDKGTFDMYSPSTQYQFKKTFKNLSNGKHTLVIKVLGTKNAGSNGTNVVVDGFIVGNTTTQDHSPSILYNKWKGKSAAGASGGSYRANGKAGRVVKFSFTGTSVDWIAAKGPTYGKAKVLIDGVDKGDFDLYDPTQQWQSAISFANLTDAQHTIEIRPLGTKNASSSGTFIIIDAFRGPFTEIGN